jgi:hypothetical protein
MYGAYNVKIRQNICFRRSELCVQEQSDQPALKQNYVNAVYRVNKISEGQTFNKKCSVLNIRMNAAERPATAHCRRKCWGSIPSQSLWDLSWHAGTDAALSPSTWFHLTSMLPLMLHAHSYQLTESLKINVVHMCPRSLRPKLGCTVCVCVYSRPTLSTPLSY